MSAEVLLGVYMTAVGPGELLTKLWIPAGKKDGFAAVTLGADGTCIADDAATSTARPCRARLCRRGTGVITPTRRRVSPTRYVPPASIRRPTSTPRPNTARISPQSSPRARPQEAAADERHVTVNGETYARDVEPRKLLIDFLRDDLDLTGSHVGCDTGNCGACSVIVDGTLVKSCMLSPSRPTARASRRSRASRRTAS